MSPAEATRESAARDPDAGPSPQAKRADSPILPGGSMRPQGGIRIGVLLLGANAFVLMVPLLAMVFNGVGMVGAYIVAVGMQNVDRGIFMENARWLLDPNDITEGVIKAVVFGVALTLIACQQGYNASGGAKGVGIATTRAVVGSFVTILVLDYFLTDLWLTFVTHGGGG